ncbi:MAG: exopolysaccharide biosynthesis polyprenyl glycosylphosphotransferase [Chloroflexota bacterium]|nr:exopolysaccharide biosynthesis polyprenyl glycosylphosphotransferase [Chloroflexota bacterium]
MATTIGDTQDDRFVDGSQAVPERRLSAVARPPADEEHAAPSEESPGAGATDVPPVEQSRENSIRRASQAALGAAALVVTAAAVGGVLQEGSGGLTVQQVIVICAGLVVSLAALTASARPRRRIRRPTRVAVIGSQATVVALEQELESAGVTSFEAVGWIAPNSGYRSAFPMPPALGELRELASVVERHRLELLLIGSDVPRLDVFDELVRLTDVVVIRVCELSAFYEDALGHIPVAEINSTWFQYVMHPKFNPTKKRAKRVFDITLAACLGVAALPLLLVSAALIKLEGGSVLYKQRRIGEKGRPFTMYKLRTMSERPADDEMQRWCSVDDPRITRVGRLLRKLHIDELPQLYNILRGEMSVVGPRPEQPDIVARLEAGIAFYSRRHLMKPGLAGWAQLRCGYVRSENGSARKLCHDLYYLKHQSLRFDLMIIVRTLLTLALPERGDGVQATAQLNRSAGRRQPGGVGRWWRAVRAHPPAIDHTPVDELE